MQKSTTTKIKFCGLTRPEDIEIVNELKPDYVGFVFWPKSKRFVTGQQVLELKRNLLPDIKAVGVFVDEDPETVAALLVDGVIDIAQLHGSEDEEYIERLRKLIKNGKIGTDEDRFDNIPDGVNGIDTSQAIIIKAIVIKGEEDIERARSSSADFLLLDSGKGTGQTFNWELIKNAELGKPYFLAGGLDPTNVAEAIKTLHPYAVDVSSGIETNGIKDPEKMRQFESAAREMK